MRILRTEASRTFNERSEAVDFIKKLEDTVRFRSIPKDLIRLGEVIDAPIYPPAYKKAQIPKINLKKDKGTLSVPFIDATKSFDIPLNLDDQMREAMEGSKLALGIWENGNAEAQPVDSTALDSILEQAGFQRSSALSNTKDKRVAKAMRTEIRAAIANEGFSLRKDEATVYECDGMVYSVRSAGYKLLPISELMEKLEEEGRKIFPNISFESCFVTQRLFVADYAINDAKLEKEIADTLSSAGIMKTGRLVIRMVTSNTGDSGANVYPILKTGRYGTIIEEPERLEHDSANASIETFGVNVGKVLALFQATPERLENLSKTGLSNPGMTMKNICMKLGLPVKMFFDKAEVFEGAYGSMATGLDLYFTISDAIQEWAEVQKVTKARELMTSSSLAKIFLSKEGIGAYDIPMQLTA